MNTMANTLNQIRKYGLSSSMDLEIKLQEEAVNRQEILNKIKDVEKVMSEIYAAIEDINTIKINKVIYRTYKENPNDKDFYSEYKPQIIAYKKAIITLERCKYKNLSIKELSKLYDEYKNKKDILMDDYSNKNILINELTQLRKNTDKYLDNELYK